MTVDTFKMKDGREVQVDWTSLKSWLSIPKKDWKEIGKELEEWKRIACTQLSGEEVYNIFVKK